MSAKRIVLFTPGHGEPGGAARRSRLLASALAKRDWDVRVVTRAGTLQSFSVLRSHNLLVVEVPGFGIRILGVVLFLALAIPLGFAWGRRATAFLSIQLMSPSTAAGICSILRRRPFVALSTTSGALSEVAYVLKATPRRLPRRVLERAAFVVAQSPGSAAELERLVPRERIRVISNPVEVVDPPPLAGRRLDALFAGRFSEEKDLLRLLDAWSEVVARHPAAVLTLVGEGGSYRTVEPELRARVSKDPVLSHSVRFAGWVPDVAPFFSSSDLFVLPSRSEGMSNALLEACAWGRVVVASDIAANRSVLGDDYPLLFAAGDTHSLARALLLAIEREELRAAARRMVLERVRRFSLPEVVRQIEELVERAADSSRHK